MELRKLNAKEFNYNIKKMLADFKNLKTRVSDLGGEYSIDEQFLDLWAAVNTMKEKEFNRFVRELQDQQSFAFPVQGRSSRLAMLVVEGCFLPPAASSRQE